jgi:hypothetical protein
MTGAEMIAAERIRQIKGEGWHEEHDDEHTECQLARAAVWYALPDEWRTRLVPFCFEMWPWENQWLKTGDRIRELVKAGALIAAEIDRLERARSKEGRT